VTRPPHADLAVRADLRESVIAPIGLVLTDWLLAAGVLFGAWIAWLLVDPIRRLMTATPKTSAPIGLLLALIAIHKSIKKLRIAQIRSFDVQDIEEAKAQLWALGDDLEPVIVDLDDAIRSAEAYLGPELRIRVAPIRALCGRTPVQIETNLRRRIESIGSSAPKRADGVAPRAAPPDAFDDELRTAVAEFGDWANAQIALRPSAEPPP